MGDDFKEDGSYIGRCRIYPYFKPDGCIFDDQAALGQYIAGEYWGRGFATEAGRAFVRFGFEELNLWRIVTTVQAGNDASVHILEKLEFELKSTEKGSRSFNHFVLQKTIVT